MWGTIDYFNKKTTDFLVLTAAASAPTFLACTNVDGAVSNNGIEFSLTGRVIDNQEFYWDVTTVFTKINNKVEGLSTDIPVGFTSGAGLASFLQRLLNGEEVGSFYGRVFLGFDSAGLNLFELDANGAEVNQIIGQALPDFTFGLTNSLVYKNFEFSFLFSGAQGNQVYNAPLANSLIKSRFLGGNNILPEQIQSDESFANITSYSSRFIEDGSYIRLNYVTLGYNIDVDNIAWLNKLRMYFTGTNLLLLTDYSGYDPEVNSLDTNINGIPPLGVDNNAYPRPRTYQLGVKVSF